MALNPVDRSPATPRAPFHLPCIGTLACMLFAACGAGEPANPYTISGVVLIQELPDGGSAVSVDATTSRQLDDGGLEEVSDAGVTLNGVPVGDPIGLAQNAGPNLYQVLAVTGSNPPASIGFACPVAISITAPAENATLDKSGEFTLEWTKGGAADGDILLVAGSVPEGSPPGSSSTLFGGPEVDAGTTSYTFTAQDLAPETDGGFDATVGVEVPGDSPDMLSRCYVTPYIDLHFR